ncbi:MAG: hypothetical protein H8E03_01295 [Pelagibacteraceae bacterium]|nr:hypothetical protein [Pelagibacteraceae bacterium]
MRTQLLCTFSKLKELNEIIDIIIACNTVLYDKIYIFQNEDDNNQLVCTYNVEYDKDFTEGIPGTISLHRKKQTNTLYTINALNDIIRELNDGVLDKTFPVPWENYRNSVMLNNDRVLTRIKTRIYKIINVNDWIKE